MGVVRTDTYRIIAKESDYIVAHEKKELLRHQGFRVKIRKDTFGLYVIYVKNIRLIDHNSHIHRARREK